MAIEFKMGFEFESYVVVHDIAKSHNVGTLARSATAFGVSELILVARPDFNVCGSHGSTSHLRFRHFHSLLDAQSFLKEKHCDIYVAWRLLAVPWLLISILSRGAPVFFSATSLVIRGTGLSAKECAICDFFIYIPQYGVGTASLNVTVAASIILHHLVVGFIMHMYFFVQLRTGGFPYYLPGAPASVPKSEFERQQDLLKDVATVTSS